MTQIFIFAVIAVVIYLLTRNVKIETHTYSRNQFAGFKLTKEALAYSELGLFTALCAKVAKADGRVDELEAELIGNMFNDISSLFPDPAQTKTLLKEIFNEEKDAPHNLDRVAQALYDVLKNDPHKRLKMVEFLINLTYIDGTLSQSEEEMVNRIGYYMGFSETEIASMMERFGSFHHHSVKESSIDQAYTLLRINTDATNDEVKKAYRSLVREYHPDIIKSQGASDDYLKEATEKVQEINAAYEMIKKARGM